MTLTEKEERRNYREIAEIRNYSKIAEMMSKYPKKKRKEETR